MTAAGYVDLCKSENPDAMFSLFTKPLNPGKAAP